MYASLFRHSRDVSSEAKLWLCEGGKRESIVDTVKVDPRLRGDDEGWMAAKALQREGDNSKVFCLLPCLA